MNCLWPTLAGHVTYLQTSVHFHWTLDTVCWTKCLPGMVRVVGGGALRQPRPVARFKFHFKTDFFLFKKNDSSKSTISTVINLFIEKCNCVTCFVTRDTKQLIIIGNIIVFKWFFKKQIEFQHFNSKHDMVHMLANRCYLNNIASGTSGHLSWCTCYSIKDNLYNFN